MPCWRFRSGCRFLEAPRIFFFVPFRSWDASRTLFCWIGWIQREIWTWRLNDRMKWPLCLAPCLPSFRRRDVKILRQRSYQGWSPLLFGLFWRGGKHGKYCIQVTRVLLNINFQTETTDQRKSSYEMTQLLYWWRKLKTTEKGSAQ